MFARSCNTPFARIALELGPQRFEEGVQRWGVGEDVPIDLPGAAASTVGDFADIDENLPLLAIRGFGQNDDQMVPLHMAMVAATVANDGEMMKPFVVDAELDHDGNVISRTQPEVWKRPISRETAGTLRDLMVGVAERGTASCCIGLNNGISVAAKTGTAQLNGPGEPRALARLDRRLRAGRGPEVRRGRDAEGHQRRDLGQHRRPSRRADRQGDARRGVPHRRRASSGRRRSASHDAAGRDDPADDRQRPRRREHVLDTRDQRNVDSVGHVLRARVAFPRRKAPEP